MINHIVYGGIEKVTFLNQLTTAKRTRTKYLCRRKNTMHKSGSSLDETYWAVLWYAIAGIVDFYWNQLHTSRKFIVHVKTNVCVSISNEVKTNLLHFASNAQLHCNILHMLAKAAVIFCSETKTSSALDCLKRCSQSKTKRNEMRLSISNLWKQMNLIWPAQAISHLSSLSIFIVNGFNLMCLLF